MTAERIAAEDAWKKQRPTAGSLVLDHVAHFVPDIEAASRALERLGFALTPFSLQQHRLAPGAPLVPAGSGNRCVMLRRGYLEFLTPTSDTPVAQRMQTAIARYIGLHLVCFGTGESARLHRHLESGGFAPQPPVALERRIGTETGEETARFTVLRVPPEAMPEGRIQIVEHHTPELLWQRRWLNHPNRATGLAASIICVGDPEEATRRYERFAGVEAQRQGRARVIVTARGSVVICGPEAVSHLPGTRPPVLPWIAGSVLTSGDLAATMAWLDRAGYPAERVGPGAIAVAAPPEVGGVFLFQAEGTRVALE